MKHILMESNKMMHDFYKTFDLAEFISYKDELLATIEKYKAERNKTRRLLKYHRTMSAKLYLPVDQEYVDSMISVLKTNETATKVIYNQIWRANAFICRFRQFKKGKTNYSIDDIKSLYCEAITGIKATIVKKTASIGIDLPPSLIRSIRDKRLMIFTSLLRTLNFVSHARIAQCLHLFEEFTKENPISAFPLTDDHKKMKEFIENKMNQR